MSGDVILNGVETLVDRRAGKQFPAALLPDPTKEADLDWVVIQIMPRDSGGLTTLQELRGWWTNGGKYYFSVPFDRRCRTRVVTVTDQGETVQYDSSEI